MTKLDYFTEVLERAVLARRFVKPDNPAWIALYELIDLVEDEIRAMGGVIPGSEVDV